MSVGLIVLNYHWKQNHCHHSVGVQGVAIRDHGPPLLQCWAVGQSAESSLRSASSTNGISSADAS